MEQALDPMDKSNNTLEVQAHNQCYRNWTGTGKTSRSDRFTGLVGPVSKKISKDRIFVQTGYGTGRNRPKLASLDWGLRKLNFFFKNQNLITWLEMMDKMFDVYYPR